MEVDAMEKSPEKPAEGRYSNSLNRSCEGCRARKIRCQPVEGSTNGKCVRCEKMKLSCIFMAPQQKRRRKRTDVRVAELEKELRYLRHRFEGRRDNSDSPSSAEQPREDGSPSEAAPIFKPEAAWEEVRRDSANREFDEDDAEDLHIDDRTAELLFTKFKADLSPLFSFLYFSDAMTAKELRDERPVLLNAILAASAESLYPPLGQALFHRIESMYAQHIFLEGKKSLELIQAMLVTALWYHPPESFSALKFTTYAHLAANMCFDIKLGKHVSQGKRPNGLFVGKLEFLESSRAFIACYIMCASMSFSMRRPTMMPYSSWLEKCIQALEQCATTRDHEIAVWARLNQIGEDSASILRFGDLHEAGLTDPRTQSMLKSYDRLLDVWKRTHWSSISTSMKINFLYIKASLHEVALHAEYAPDEFEPPYLMRPHPLRSRHDVELIPAYVSSINTCLQCAHGMLDLFFTLSTIDIRSAYVILVTQAFYSIIILTKLMICIRSPNSSIGRILEPEAVKLNDYMARLLELLKDATGTEEYNMPATFYFITLKLSSWYRRQETQPDKIGVDDLLEPLKYISASDRAEARKEGAERAHTHGNEGNNGQSTSPDQIPAASTFSDPFAVAPLPPPVLWTNEMNQDVPVPAHTGTLPNIPTAWMDSVDTDFRGSQIGNTTQMMFGGLGGGFESLWSSNAFNASAFYDDAPMLMFAGDEPDVTNGAGFGNSNFGKT